MILTDKILTDIIPDLMMEHKVSKMNIVGI